MKIIELKTNPQIYSSKSYLVLGSWNKLSDVNTVIDTGSDSYIINHIERINTGVGKKCVDKVILTHNHFDHVGGIKEIKKKYGAEILAFNKMAGVDRLLKDGEEILIGDCYFQVIHTPGHSSDSVCLYCKSERILFSGDTAIRVYTSDHAYTDEYIKSLERLSMLRISIIYPGHGEPFIDSPEKILKKSLENMKSSTNENKQVISKTMVGN